MIQLDGDVLAEEVAWATLPDDIDAAGNNLEEEKSDDIEEVIRFKKPQLARHLRPLYIKAYIDGKPISRVLIDGGDIMNVMLLGILRKLGKTLGTLKRPI